MPGIVPQSSDYLDDDEFQRELRARYSVELSDDSKKDFYEAKIQSELKSRILKRALSGSSEWLIH
jgi:hypothetical protein